MPRLARLDAPELIHHVIIRGIERRKIFRDNKDRDDMIDRLSDLLPATRTECYAWAFLSNHAHFLFRSGDAGLPTLMRWLLTGYAVKFNRRHGGGMANYFKIVTSPSFARSKIRLRRKDTYLKELVRYIHLNPVKFPGGNPI